MSELPLTRREFIRQATGGSLGFLAFSGFAPAFLVRNAQAQNPAPERDRSILVIIQLAGGNDGLNTVIPFSDDNYFKLRPKLGLRQNLLPLNDELALHPSLRELHRLFESGQLSVIQNVGYPNPHRSHFRSMEIWETASSSDAYRSTGWIGRFLDNNCSGAPELSDPTAIHVGHSLPQAYLAKKALSSTFGVKAHAFRRKNNRSADQAYQALLQSERLKGNANYLQHTMMDALVTERRVEKRIAQYKPNVAYPGSPLGQSLKRIAALIHADLETRVYFVSQSGYDTHANQLNRHARLLAELSQSMGAFQRDLAASQKEDQVLTMTFSEFGRRPSENGSSGTDHGTAAPLFIMGKKATGGLLGNPPNLNLNPGQDLQFSVDFRSVYATVLDHWLEANANQILDDDFARLPFLAKI